MDGLELYRSMVTLAGVVGFGINTTIVFGLLRHRHRIPHLTSTLAGYAAATAAVAAVAVFWRVRDEYVAVPLNVGDFTALVPCLGSLIAGVVAVRQVGRILGREPL